jgi:hypothetical protein
VGDLEKVAQFSAFDYWMGSTAKISVDVPHVYEFY